ncbi:threonine exporter [Corynebacterium pilosum]|uniref:Threonine exporter n=1 Tax=Corynebacterium pilosum TaxID=35756 RepID=A0A376CJY3_9CORY|nr:threonine exporter [Corynebacterium pilosum]
MVFLSVPVVRSGARTCASVHCVPNVPHALKKLWDKIRGSQVATIDEATTSPPPSPLAPVDLTDPAQVTAVMNIAARIGDILLSSGTSNADTRAQIHTVASSYGLHYLHIDITFSSIRLHTTIGTTVKTPINVMRVVDGMDPNFSKLTQVDNLIRSIRAGGTRPEIAEKILDEIYLAPPPYGPKLALVGWAVFGGAVAILFGGGFGMAALGGLTSLAIMSINGWLGKHSMPYFFQCVAGGLLATLPAAVAYEIAASAGITFRPSLVIASGIVVLLAGLSLVQSLQDGITGAPVTASARFFETMLNTGGIVAGVATGIQLSAMFGSGLPPMESMGATATFGSAGAIIIAGTVTSAAFAVASYGDWSAVWVAGASSLFGSIAYYLVLLPAQTSPVLAAAICAVMVGLAGGLLARRFGVPPLITQIAGVTPFLPGLTTYRAMYGILNDQLLIGFANLGTAVGTALALAAGVTFGEWVARRIRRPQVITPYRAFRAAGRMTFQQIRRAERIARSQKLVRPAVRLPRRHAQGNAPGTPDHRKSRGQG